MIEITGIRFDGGDGHEHISDVLWRSAATSLACSPRQAIVDWLEKSNENQAVVAGGSAEVQVAVVRRSDQPPYLRARADGVWSDELLGLPSF
jgi:Protein of unknown function (DUF3892)